MRRTYISELSPGSVLGKAIHNERGDTLLAAGVVLTEALIESLEAHGFYAVYVMDGFADDLEPPDLLSDRVRIATYKHVHELFAFVRDSLPLGSSVSPRAIADIVKGIGPCLANLYRDVEAIVDEVAGVATLSGVVSLKSHDNYTFEHSIDVTVAGAVLGFDLGLREEHLRQLTMGCLCHDIGKITVPTEILSKESVLTPEEYEIVKGHAQAGYDAARQVIPEEGIFARQVVWQHHERQNGAGYPRGLTGTNVFTNKVQAWRGTKRMLPLAEIAAVADVYAALASDRPYRRALTPPAIVASLRNMAGHHLNSELVVRFLSILPIYPVGTEVEITSGSLKRWRGIVSAINPQNTRRPRVRVLFDDQDRQVEPFEIDCAREKSVQISTAPSRELASAV